MCSWKERIPKEISELIEHEDIIDYSDFLHEYFLNCIMHNSKNIFNNVVMKELSYFVDESTEYKEILNAVHEGKDRFITTYNNINKIKEYMSKIGVDNYRIFSREN